LFESLKKSKTVFPLITGFIGLMSLMSLLWLTHTTQIQEQFDIIEAEKQSAQKMHLIARLASIARERTKLTNKMYSVEDLFERDKIAMKLDVYASQFVKYKTELLKLPLTAFEKNEIKFQNTIIPHILKSQRKAAELAMSNESELMKQGQQLLYVQVFPEQEKLLDSLEDMLSGLEENINKASALAYAKNLEYKKLSTVFLFIFLLLSFFIAFYSIKKTLSIERDLQVEKNIARLTLMSIGDAIVITDRNSNIVDINSTTETMLGMSRAKVVGQNFSSIINIEVDENHADINSYLKSAILNGVIQVVAENTSVYSPLKKRRCYVDILLSPINDYADIIGCIITLRDVTEKKHLHKKLEYQAKYDALTGLLNRHAFEEQYQSIFNELSDNQTLSLCFMDLDKFKTINDSCGHKAGDEVLKQISRIIGSCLRAEDIVSRQGGDEFCILLKNCNAWQAKKIAHNLVRKISDYSITCDEQLFSLGCSVGIAQVSTRTSSYSDVMHQADIACYKAKDDGCHQVCIAVDNRA